MLSRARLRAAIRRAICCEVHRLLTLLADSIYGSVNREASTCGGAKVFTLTSEGVTERLKRGRVTPSLRPAAVFPGGTHTLTLRHERKAIAHITLFVASESV